MKYLRYVLATVCAGMFLWLFASFCDVNTKNMNEGRYAPWNAFELFCSEVQAKQESALTSKRNSKKEDKLYTKGNILLLAKLIEAENGSAKHDQTLVLTGVCVLKRVKSKSFPNTIRGVIYQTGKGWRAYSTAPNLENVSPSERAMEIAEELLIYGVEEYPDSLVYQAMFPQGRKTYKKIDGEYFCLK